MPDLTRRGFLGAAGLTAAGLMVSSCSRRAQTGSGVTDSEWADLKGSLRGTVVRPGDADYQGLAAPINQRFSETMPDAVVKCTNAEDVAATIQWARTTNTPFAIRGGGNNYSSASSSRGILISTRPMNAVHVDGATLRAGGGVLNSDLARALPQDGKGEFVLPTGPCRTLGVVGQTLGGGIGPNTPWAGLTADRLRKATVVTADGTIVTATDTENPDLLWALRGGAGANFGVITDVEYELAKVPVRRATTARLTFPGRDAALAAAVAFQQLRAEGERNASSDLHLHRADGGVQAVLTAQILRTEAEARDVLAPLLRIQGVTSEIVERPWWDTYASSLKDAPPPRSFWNRSLYADDFLPDDTLGDALDVISRYPGTDPDAGNGSVHILGWVGGVVDDVAPDATAYIHRQAWALLETSVWWATPDQAELPVTPIPGNIRTWGEQLWEVLLPHTTGRAYQNFPDPELDDWTSAYYGDNLVKLEGLKSKWDPADVFQFFQGIPLPR